jgi:hypothetical protein
MRITHILSALLIPIFCYSQGKPGSYKDFFMEGSYLLLENNAKKARDNFEQAYKLDSSSANINYLLGMCYLQSALQKDKAEVYLQRACQNITKSYRTDDHTEKAAAPLALFYYGQALHINYKFDEAQAQYEKFRSYVNLKDKEFINMIDRAEEITKVAKDMTAKPISVQITNMGDSINSPYAEYSAVLSADERMIIFTTRRSTSTGGMKTEDDEFFEDIVISYRDDKDTWTRPVSIGYNVNTISHEASINLSPDGQTLIIYKLDITPKNPEGDGNLYYSTFDGKEWSHLKDFGSNVNSPHQESHACLSADGNVLFFTSERPGGFGGKDIYRCIKLPNGKWSKALNMGPVINTEYDEDGAFIHPDGQTFFFTSNGHTSMGGFDIMFATLNEDNKFSNVKNMGYPINTTDDDIFYVTSPDGKRAYMSSAKAGGYGNLDIYKITIAEGKESFLALFKGQLVPAEGEKLPDNILIIVTDKMSNEIVGTYRPKIVNGTFSTILPPGKEYNFSYQTEDGDEFYNEDVYVSNDMAYQEIRREVMLEPVKIGGKLKVKQKNISLNVIVLNNSRQKQPVNGAKITVEEVNGAKQIFTSDKSGRHEAIPLTPEKKYLVSCEFNGKVPAPAEISTMGAKSAKIINQILYLDGKHEKPTSKELLLDVTVKTVKNKRAIAEATVTVTDTESGEMFQAITDKKGVARGIELSPDSKYEIMATMATSASEKEVLKTGSIGAGQKYEKTLLLDYELGGNQFSNLPTSEFEFYYAYGRKNVDESEETWINFINTIVTLAEKKKIVKINIRSSASRVPRRAKGGNLALATARGKKLEMKIRDAAKRRGVKLSKLRFIRTAKIGGPKYQGDWNIGRKKYEAHQYSKARVR